MKTGYKVLIIIGLIIIVLVTASALFIHKIEEDLKGLKSLEIEDIDLSKIDNGEYNGEYTALPIIVETKTYIKDGKIDRIEIIKHINGQGKNAEKIIESIIEKQKINVDTISGATYSSIVIQKAIEESLSRIDK